MLQEEQELPVRISPLAIPRDPSVPIRLSQCPSNDSSRESRDMLRNITRPIIYDASISLTCGPGKWERVFYLNASASDLLLCPDDWNIVTDPVSGCGGMSASCSSAFSDSIDTAYSKVCGRIIGEGVMSPDAFHLSLNDSTVEGNYLDGVSITHGASGSRTHIWSFGAGHLAGGGLVSRCPCDNNNRTDAPLPPAEVGDNFFCDRADGFDPLWTGESCTNTNPCCSFNNPPYFSVQLPAATTDRIELRICTDQDEGDEAVLVLFSEVYVQ